MIWFIIGLDKKIHTLEASSNEDYDLIEQMQCKEYLLKDLGYLYKPTLFQKLFGKPKQWDNEVFLPLEEIKKLIKD